MAASGLVTQGDYQIRLIVRDNAFNVSTGFENPATNFAAGTSDTVDPVGAVANPADEATYPIDITTVQGTATDDKSGIDIVRVQVRRVSTPREYWNGTELGIRNPRQQ